MSEIQVIDNFLGTVEFNKIQTLMLRNGSVSWSYNPFVNSEKDPEHYFQFTHTFYADALPQSKHWTELYDVLKKLKIFSLIRIKANLLTKSAEIVEHGYHVDFEPPHSIFKTAVFYINTNNGYTKFEDGTKVESVANRMVVFDGNLKHTGTTCTDSNVRVVVNFNYYQR
jgi:hypothetical protein